MARSRDGLKQSPWRLWTALQACLQWWCTFHQGEQQHQLQATQQQADTAAAAKPSLHTLPGRQFAKWHSSLQSARRRCIAPLALMTVLPPPALPRVLPCCSYHQYKFIVDGKWMHDETAPYMPDPLGNVNNWLFVRKVDPPAAAPG